MLHLHSLMAASRNWPELLWQHFNKLWSQNCAQLEPSEGVPDGAQQVAGGKRQLVGVAGGKCQMLAGAQTKRARAKMHLSLARQSESQPHLTPLSTHSLSLVTTLSLLSLCLSLSAPVETQNYCARFSALF